MGKGVRFRFDREVVTKGGRDDSFVRHRSIERVTAGGRVGSKREGALVCNGEELRRDGGGGGDGGFKRTGLFE